MPIYEYLCRDCNTVYQFFSRTSFPKSDPNCPKQADHAPLERQLSRFAIGARGSDTEAAASGPDLDPAAAAKLDQLMGKMEGIDENDPKAMGRLMREMSALTGEGADDPAMQEAIRRLEGGEDPERVEELLDGRWGEEPGSGSFGSPPGFDSSLYEM
jgi:putative FmdB family regulatory protein